MAIAGTLNFMNYNWTRVKQEISDINTSSNSLGYEYYSDELYGNGIDNTACYESANDNVTIQTEHHTNIDNDLFYKEFMRECKYLNNFTEVAIRSKYTPQPPHQKAKMADVMTQVDSSLNETLRQKRGKRKRMGRGTGTSPYTTIPLPPCKICGGLATGYHFGVITCEACKAFFRRALIHNHNYKCIKDDDCEITDKKLGNCSACRLHKCFAYGMSKGGIRRGRYSIAIRTQAILDAKSQAAGESFVDPHRAPLAKRQKFGSPENIITSFSDSGKNLYTFESLLDDSEIANDGKIAITVDERSLSDDEHLQSFLEETVSSVGRASLSVATSETVIDTPPTVKKVAEGTTFVENQELEYLIDTVMSCQEAVYPKLKKQYIKSLEENHYKIYEEFNLKEEVFEDLFGTTGKVSTTEFQQIFAVTGLDLDDRLVLFNQKGKAMEESIAQYVNFAKLVPGFKNLNPKDVSKLLKAAHMEFWLIGNYMLYNSSLGVCSGWDGSDKSRREDMLKFFEAEHIDAIFMFSDRLKSLNLTLEEIALIQLIVLTYTDRCPLIDVPKVQSLQDKYLECLQYYLEKTSPNPSQRLYKIFDKLLAMRDLTYSNVSANKKFLKEWDFVMHDYPLWNEMLAYDGE